LEGGGGGKKKKAHRLSLRDDEEDKDSFKFLKARLGKGGDGGREVKGGLHYGRTMRKREREEEKERKFV